jgi:2-C-methyl-D-erythritol 4-phosphate cytidylyltransferase
MIIAALIVAAGRGARMGASTPKALLPLGGEPILARALAAFRGHPRIDGLVAVVTDPAEARSVLGKAASGVALVPGGRERQESVRRGLEAIDDASIVLVHDAARPLVPRGVIDAVIEGTLRHGAAVPAIPVADTLKRRNVEGAIGATVPRDDLVLAQTPQGFRTELLRAAYDRAEREGFLATDDASLLERAGVRVVLVPGSARNIKITTPADLALAEALLAIGGKEGSDG